MGKIVDSKEIFKKICRRNCAGRLHGSNLVSINCTASSRSLYCISIKLNKDQFILKFLLALFLHQYCIGLGSGNYVEVKERQGIPIDKQ